MPSLSCRHIAAATAATFFHLTKVACAFPSPNPPKSPFPASLNKIVSSNPFRDNPLGGSAEEAAAEQKAKGILEEFGDWEPKPFNVRPEQVLDVIVSSFLAIFRLGSGVFADGYALSIVSKDPTRYTVASVDSYQLEESCSRTAAIKAAATRYPLIIYEFEACPFCRKVREATSILSLEVTYKPCPANGAKYRRPIKEQYGKGATFPFLIDPNTGVEMFESDDIIDYLFRTYGDEVVPNTLLPGFLAPLTAGLGLLPRFGRGGKLRPSNPPQQPLILWAYEGSPFCKIVRETLCELEIQHTQISCPRGSPNRQRMFEKVGRFQVPYLEDPNNSVRLFESAAIVEYLGKMYGVKESPVQYL